MYLAKTKIHLARESGEFSSKAKTGVSMHCHTEHSKEMLDFLPHYAEKLPIIAYFWEKERASYRQKNGTGIDFSTSYWAPPMDAPTVYNSEKDQINGLGLDAIVSITDHDSIDGTLELNAGSESAKVPVSLEWTVPFDFGFFHLGVHNLPSNRAVDITKELLDYTFEKENHTDEKLTELLSMLSDLPNVLVILNHPMWDIEIVGQAAHELLLKAFLDSHGKWIHALEVNGFRSWSENKAVIDIAEARGIPVVTGGDRHGCKPNTVVNLTNSDTFDGFVSEVRVDKHSEVVLMPEYRHPLVSRQLQSFSEILSFYPEHPEIRRRWFDRVFYDLGDEKGLASLAEHGWRRGGPIWLRWAIKTLAHLGSPRMRPLFRLAVRKKDRLPKALHNHVDTNQDFDTMSPTLSSGTV